MFEALLVAQEALSFNFHDFDVLAWGVGGDFC